MKIAVVELNFHWDSLDALCRLFDGDGHQVFVFTRDFIFDYLKYADYTKRHHFIIMKGNSYSHFLKQQAALLNGMNCIFINTMSRDFKAWATINLQPTTILRIHNTYKTFDPWHHIRILPSPYYWWKAFSYMMREMLWGGFAFYRKSALKKINYFTFPDTGLKEYALQQGYVNNEQVAPDMPIKFYEKNAPLPIKDAPLRFTIIGALDPRRREYDPVYDAFKKAALQFQEPVELTFLGNGNTAFGKEMISKFSKIQNKNFSIRYFLNVVQQAEFQQWLEQTHVIISPIRQDAQVEIFREEYGKSKISGTVTDLVNYPRPVILPNFYKVEGALQPLCTYYTDSQSLYDAIVSFTHNRNKIFDDTFQINELIKVQYNLDYNRRIFFNFIKTITN